ncbi:hypothetical protein G7059_10010 [Erysipelothrix sp. HDW6A]|uniref:hypothetical protein n=1 Tax=Erysipelothrix sp. HDW6A TaxID=2714928 RepID=UPI001408DA82|nr:hypothetical protein [Erysipelothrix sp. HDW6A]QIK58152.1 hypothetical protein G7059_10010 [Erysipelothrix sp. HDW6A]
MYILTLISIILILAFGLYKKRSLLKDNKEADTKSFFMKYGVVAIVILGVVFTIDYQNRNISTRNQCINDTVIRNHNSYFKDSDAYNLCTTEGNREVFVNPNKAYQRFMLDYGFDALGFAASNFEPQVITKQGMRSFSPCCDLYRDEDRPVLKFIDIFQISYMKIPINLVTKEGYSVTITGNSYFDSYTDSSGKLVKAEPGRIFLESSVSISNPTIHEFDIGVKDIKVVSEKGETARFIPFDNYLSLETETIDENGNKRFVHLKSDEGVHFKIISELPQNEKHFFEFDTFLGTKEKYQVKL